MTADHREPRGARACPREAERIPRNLQMTRLTVDQAVGLRRQATRGTLATFRLARLEETAVLFVSALLTDAVRHAWCADAIALAPASRFVRKCRWLVSDCDVAICGHEARVAGRS